jgi:hypothetical protein
MLAERFAACIIRPTVNIGPIVKKNITIWLSALAQGKGRS